MTSLHAVSDTIYAIQHLAFEDLGQWEEIFYQLGFRVRYFEAGVDDLRPALAHDGLVVILGGPIAVYEQQDYPFLHTEIQALQQRLANNQPTLGICLGAQLIAYALGAPVYAGKSTELGWSCLQLHHSAVQPLAALADVAVLHWHGDTFELPEHAVCLASTAQYPNQAFQLGNNILALQFHAEVAPEQLEKWLIGHRCQLGQAGIDIKQLRADNQRYAPALAEASGAVLQHFLKQLVL